MNKNSLKSNNQENGILKKIPHLDVTNHYVAGIDVSDKEMMVAYPINNKELVIQAFGTFTTDLHILSQTLKKHNIKSVAMESTGVYWINLFLLLKDEGFEVSLVNAKHTKNVSGRKTDQSDAEWIYKLHSCELLSSSFQPENDIRVIRNLVRHRLNLVRTSSTYINRIQKSLELMNIKLHTVISDLTGVSGKRILQAIINGERDPKVLAKLCDRRIKATEDTIIKSLEGYWREDLLFELRSCYEIYQFHQAKIIECENEIKQAIEQLIASANEGELPATKVEKRKVSSKNKLSFDLSSMLLNLTGVDLTGVNGISELTALSVISEIGLDMTKWKDGNYFASWCGLTPNIKESGGKIISSRLKKKKHYINQTLRMAASGLANSKCALGDFYRKIRSRAGAPKANVATARKLAIIIFNMLKKREDFNPHIMKKLQDRNKERLVNYYQKKLAQLEAA